MLTNDELLCSDIVANSVMNRQRGLAGVNSYERELHVDLLGFLTRRAGEHGGALWCDVCCGEGNALREAAEFLTHTPYRDEILLVGVDLVDAFAPADLPNLRLIAQDVSSFTPPRPADLVTCVHGLHYLGDKLGFVEEVYRHIAPGGFLLAHLDRAQILFQEESEAWPAVLRQARGRKASIRLTKGLLRIEKTIAPLDFGVKYLGATISEKPNYTGIVGIDSWYAPAG